MNSKPLLSYAQLENDRKHSQAMYYYLQLLPITPSRGTPEVDFLESLQKVNSKQFCLKAATLTISMHTNAHTSALAEVSHPYFHVLT